MRVPTFFIAATTLLFELFGVAAPIRVASLAESSPLQETLNLLPEFGCSKSAVTNFQAAIEHCRIGQSDLDFIGFTRSPSGFYEFKSAEEFATALHSLQFRHSDKPFNCFDAVILLAADRMTLSRGPDDLAGLILADANVSSNGQQFGVIPVATARDAFDDSYPPQYRDAVTNLFPASLLDARIILTADFSGAYVLPKSTTEQQVEKNVLAIIQQAWRQQGIGFPKQFQIVLCQDVYLPRLVVVSTHAGLLLKQKTGYCYLEKMSLTGPFLRLDLQDKRELNLFLADRCKGSTFTHHFVTFNDTEIEQLQFR